MDPDFNLETLTIKKYFFLSFDYLANITMLIIDIK